MNNLKNNPKRDSRLTILLFILFCLFLSDCIDWQYRFFTGNSARNGGTRLQFSDQHNLIVAKISDEYGMQENLSVPARYTPFFFQPVPINFADKDMLMTIKGIGPSLADSIVEYRHQFGPFATSFDLQNLKSVGPQRAVNLATAFTFSEEP